MKAGSGIYVRDLCVLTWNLKRRFALSLFVPRGATPSMATAIPQTPVYVGWVTQVTTAQKILLSKDALMDRSNLSTVIVFAKMDGQVVFATPPFVRSTALGSLDTAKNQTSACVRLDGLETFAENAFLIQAVINFMGAVWTLGNATAKVDGAAPFAMRHNFQEEKCLSMTKNMN